MRTGQVGCHHSWGRNHYPAQRPFCQRQRLKISRGQLVLETFSEGQRHTAKEPSMSQHSLLYILSPPLPGRGGSSCEVGAWPSGHSYALSTRRTASGVGLEVSEMAGCWVTEKGYHHEVQLDFVTPHSRSPGSPWGPKPVYPPRASGARCGPEPKPWEELVCAGMGVM